MAKKPVTAVASAKSDKKKASAGKTESPAKNKATAKSEVKKSSPPKKGGAVNEAARKKVIKKGKDKDAKSTGSSDKSAKASKSAKSGSKKPENMKDVKKAVATGSRRSARVVANDAKKEEKKVAQAEKEKV